MDSKNLTLEEAIKEAIALGMTAENSISEEEAIAGDYTPESEGGNE